MDDETRSERFDRAVAQLLEGPPPESTGDEEMDGLLIVADRLRRLPRRSRLRAELERKA